ncbi:MAG: linked oxidase-like protein [Streptosporangiaceae bacterium]|nr:linked oxidase-like protein [Streptosporangiaceae bacterium]
MPLDDDSISRFAQSFGGQVLQPTDPEFAHARTEAIWNGAITRQPALIVRPVSAEDVATALAFIRASGVDATVRGGGHNGAGNAVAEGAVMIDLSRMNGVRVDAAARRAYVGGGASWASLDAATAPHGLAVVGGTVSHTGVAGLSLSGGMGWLLSLQGLACDNLVGATLVTAAGRVVAVSDETEPDLMWALRGAGTNFGVVTELVFALHEVSPMANLGLVFWGLEDAAAALAFAREYLFELPTDMGAAIVGLSAPPAPFVPEQHRGLPGVAVIVTSWGDAEDHAAALAPLRELNPLFEVISPIPHVALQQLLDDANPWGGLAYDKGLNLDELSDGAIDVFLTWIAQKRSPLSYVPIFALKGRYREIPDEATAFGSPRSARWGVGIVALATDEETFAADRAWVRGFWEALHPYTPNDAVYVNFEADLDQQRMLASYGEQKYRRLAALKAVWDPENMFRHNPNIPPAAAGIPSPRAAAARAEQPAS